MNALIIFLTGIAIGVIVEPLPKYVKTIVWVVLVVIGVLYGALGTLTAL